MKNKNCNFPFTSCQTGGKNNNRFLYSSPVIFQWQKLGCRAIPSMFSVSASRTKGEIFPANALNISLFAKWCSLSPLCFIIMRQPFAFQWRRKQKDPSVPYLSSLWIQARFISGWQERKSQRQVPLFKLWHHISTLYILGPPRLDREQTKTPNCTCYKSIQNEISSFSPSLSSFSFPVRFFFFVYVYIFLLLSFSISNLTCRFRFQGCKRWIPTISLLLLSVQCSFQSAVNMGNLGFFGSASSLLHSQALAALPFRCFTPPLSQLSGMAPSIMMTATQSLAEYNAHETGALSSNCADAFGKVTDSHTVLAAYVMDSFTFGKMPSLS